MRILIVFTMMMRFGRRCTGNIIFDTFLRLNRKDIDELESFITSDASVKSDDTNRKVCDLQFCGNARRAMDEGDAVYYYCWG